MRKSTALLFEKFGAAKEVLQYKTIDLPPLNDHDVLVKTLAAPVNPSDMYYISGIYGVRPKLPAVAGLEGASKVVEVGSAVKLLKVGDHVIPGGAAKGHTGTWQTHNIYNENHLRVIDSRLPAAIAGILTVNPTTAYQMLRVFAGSLVAGDVIMQNGATSAVGIYVIQMAHKLGLRTVNVIRARPTDEETEKVKQQLAEFGADLVLTENEVKSPEGGEKIRALSESKSVQLAFDCVGGSQSADLLQFIGKNGKLVSYGLLSGEPMQLSPIALIFNSISVHGFWISEWFKNPPTADAVKEMFDDITQQFLSGELKPSPYEEFTLNDWQNALWSNAQALSGLPRKKIFIFS